jgi:hypothetical protein
VYSCGYGAPGFGALTTWYIRIGTGESCGPWTILGRVWWRALFGRVAV